MPSLLSHPPLLAHTIYQALAFDASLREDGFSLIGTVSGRDADDADWKGISEIILGRKEWFDSWVEGEKACKLGVLIRVPCRHSRIYIFSRHESVLRNSWCQGRLVDN